MGCTLEKAIAFKEAYSKGFPGIAKYKEKASKIVRNKGYILLCPITGHKTYWAGFNKWKEVFELRDIYNQIKNKYEVTYKELKVDNNAKTNRVIAMALAVSLVLNVINFIVLLRLL